MKFCVPKYYKDFKCIADKCTHSCCIGWEIDIDNNTLEKYSRLNHEYREAIIESIDRDGDPHFRLSINERCPHLDEKGLCKIITNLDESYLCEICREHPRFYLNSEMGLGMACEEACRVILSSDNYDELEETSTCGAVSIDNSAALMERTRLFGILKNNTLKHEEKLNYIYNAYSVSPKDYDDGELRTLLLSLEYLNEKHKELFQLYSSDTRTPKELEKQLERALAYFIFRHCTDAIDPQELRAALGFALVCERLICTVACELGDIELASRIVSEEIEYSTENTDEIKNLF